MRLSRLVIGLLLASPFAVAETTPATNPATPTASSTATPNNTPPRPTPSNTTGPTDLVIEISKPANNTTPVAVVPFGTDQSDSLGSIIRADLSRSGLFKTPTNLPAQPTTSTDINYSVWQVAGLDYVVVGSVTPLADNTYTIQYELASSNQQKRLLGETLNHVEANRWRDAAHFISDRIFRQLTGLPGAFNSRVAYVLESKANGKIRYQLQIADADGQRPQTVLDSPEPILSPSWSPDGQKLAYVSFETGKPAVYVQTLANQQRDLIASFKGLNGAPSWSPDGKKLALTLSQDGNPEIYMLELANKKLTRLTNHYAIDTEARWSPDGRSLIFTSDRGGNPQIYRLMLDSLDVERLTYDGNFNARGALSPDGRYLAMVHRERGQTFQIAIQDLQTGILSTLTDAPLDESPSFAPNSQMLVYATRQGNQGVLGIMSLDGSFKLRLPATNGQVREPAWSP